MIDQVNIRNIALQLLDTFYLYISIMYNKYKLCIITIIVRLTFIGAIFYLSIDFLFFQDQNICENINGNSLH